MLLSAEEYDAWYYTEKGKYISGLEKRVLLKMINPTFVLPLFKGRIEEGLLLGISILDIGCGTGYFTEFLGTLCRNVVGIDASVDMIKHAHEKHKDSNIKYLVADAENLPFKNGSLDISVSIAAVNFFKNPTKAVSEAVRISRKKIFLGVLNKWSMLSFFKKLKSLFKNTSYSDACFYSQRDIVNILCSFMQIKKVYKQHTYFLPFPRIHLILSGIEKLIPSWLPFGGFMGILGDIERGCINEQIK